MVRIINNTPNGVLIFCPSYSFLRSFKRWLPNDQKKRVKKKLFWEDDANDLQVFSHRYFTQAQSSKGAVLFGVFRGKLSEGFDYNDSKARAVITIGIPFPAFNKEVQMKKAYNDSRRKESAEAAKNAITGDQWYVIEAMRALNQALGRVIRHRNDWGSMFLLDYRFTENHYKKGLSTWIKKALDGGHFDQIMEDYENFVQENGNKKIEVKPVKTLGGKVKKDKTDSNQFLWQEQNTLTTQTDKVKLKRKLVINDQIVKTEKNSKYRVAFKDLPFPV